MRTISLSLIITDQVTINCTKIFVFQNGYELQLVVKEFSFWENQEGLRLKCDPIYWYVALFTIRYATGAKRWGSNFESLI